VAEIRHRVQACATARADVMFHGSTFAEKAEMTMTMKKKLIAGAGLGAILLGGSVAFAQTGQNVDWTAYTGDITGSRFKSLDQINASNFSKLEVAWRFKTDNIGNRPEFKLEGTPLEINGVVYTTAGSRRGVVALDAVAGARRWVPGVTDGARGAAAP
jgi:quinoprotein glucose dehydrogenase